MEETHLADDVAVRTLKLLAGCARWSTANFPMKRRPDHLTTVITYDVLRTAVVPDRRGCVPVSATR